MSKLCLLVLLIIPLAANAQDTVSVYARLAPASQSSGNGAQVGIGFDIYSSLGSRFAFDGDLSLVRETKVYVGDGWTFRSQAEGLIRVAGPVMAGGGVSYGRHSNSQYTKGQFQPMLSVHYRPSAAVDVYGTYLFSGSGLNNDNSQTTLRAGYRGVWALNPQSNWGIFLQGEYSRFWFDQPGQGRLSGNSVTIAIGASRIIQR